MRERERKNESETERERERERERLQEDSLCGWSTENWREVQKVGGGPIVKTFDCHVRDHESHAMDQRLQYEPHMPLRAWDVVCSKHGRAQFWFFHSVLC